MPELPEVETIRRDLAGSLVGREIKSVELVFAKTAHHEAAFFVGFLSGRKIKAISRRGKLLIIELSRKKGETIDSFLLVHLKMTGQLILADHGRHVAGGHSLSGHSFADALGGELPNRHTRAIISLKGGAILFFNDLRKFGYLKLADREELNAVITKNYGPEPLTPEFTAAYLTSALKGKRVNIKAFLLNQKIIAGLGNIYVDEALFASGIRPQRLAAQVTPAEAKKLHQEINKIIAAAIERRGTTFNNYVDSAGRKGNFSSRLKVYGRGKEPCVKCGRY